MAPLAAAGLHFIVFLGSVRENRNADRVKNYLLQTLAKNNISVTLFGKCTLNTYYVCNQVAYAI